jgi:eukaryotic-like serine/threonine-protein kinase
LLGAEDPMAPGTGEEPGTLGGHSAQPGPPGAQPGTCAGQLLADRYRLDSLIAAGGMGEVWRGTDELLGRAVAVKLIRDVHAADAAFLSRFRAEARFAAKLSHPGIAQVFDYGEQDGSSMRRPYLVMELVPGRQLSALIDQAGALPTSVVLDITAQAARALQAAHNLGITHRDVKPANLLITDGGRVKITDFGIAAAPAGTQATDGTGSGFVMGTAAYMSPEQAQGKRVTPASDIYSLGIVAYQCVAGRMPFTGETPMALALAHAQSKPLPLPTGIPAGVRDLIMQMIAKEPERRPASARDAAEAADLLRIEMLPDHGGPQLADVAAWVAAGIGEPGTGADVAGTTVVNPRLRAGRRRRHRAVLVAALMCAAAGGVSAVLATGMLGGSPAAVTRHIPTQSPVAQAPAPTPRVTPRHSKARATEAPLTVSTGQPSPTVRVSSPRPSPSHSTPRTHSPSPTPTTTVTPTSPTSTPT